MCRKGRRLTTENLYNLYRTTSFLSNEKETGLSNGCWITDKNFESKYAQWTCPDGKMMYIHRQSYVWFNGPLEDDMYIDHLCLNKKCWNPDHLEKVTKLENNVRSLGWKDGKCKRGHDLSIYLKLKASGKYKCMMCERLSGREFDKYRRKDRPRKPRYWYVKPIVTPDDIAPGEFEF